MEYDEDIYEKEIVDEMLDGDEISAEEAGMMLDYDEDFDRFKEDFEE